MSDEAPDLLALARDREARGDLGAAATAYDRLYGLDPENAQVAAARSRLLDRLAISEHGITFRYIPAGVFLMGSGHGEADERPVHRVELDAYWLSETPVSWATYCRLMDWEPPPHARPRGSGVGFQGHWETIGSLLEDNKIRVQYCEDATNVAGHWIWHIPEVGDPIREKLGGRPRERRPDPLRYELKPMVSVPWQDAEDLCARLSRGPTSSTGCRPRRSGRRQRAAASSVARIRGVTRRQPATSVIPTAYHMAPSGRCGSILRTATACTRCAARYGSGRPTGTMHASTGTVRCGIRPGRRPDGSEFCAADPGRIARMRCGCRFACPARR